MVLRELRNNPEWNYRPVGFIDDDPLKKGKIINGLQVYDSNGTLAEIVRRKGHPGNIDLIEKDIRRNP